MKLKKVTFSGIDHNDHPDYTDAFIDSAERNGVKLTDSELEEVNNNSSLVYELLMEYLR